jgi:dTDP-4-amino-4,6-dideoxygalactose transaminase
MKANRYKYPTQLGEDPVPLLADLRQMPLEGQHIYHLFQIRTDRRDGLLACLQAAGIGPVIPSRRMIHFQTADAECGWRKGQVPVAERPADELLFLQPCPDLGEAEVAYVFGKVHEFLSERP